MRYSELEREIFILAERATDSARIRFADHALERLSRAAKPFVESQFNSDESHHLDAALQNLKGGEHQKALESLNELSNSISADEVRAIEFERVITELLCVIEYYCDYLRTKNGDAIASIGVSLVNFVDHSIDPVPDSYSADNILGAPEMQAEWNSQREILSKG